MFRPWVLWDAETTDQSVLYYITGFCAKKALKKVSCSDCKEMFSQSSPLAGYSSLIEHFENENLFYPSLFTMQKFVTLDYILHSFVLGKFKKKFYDSKNKFKLIMGVLETQVDIDHYCSFNHSVRDIFKKMFHSFVNIFWIEPQTSNVISFQAIIWENWEYLKPMQMCQKESKIHLITLMILKSLVPPILKPRVEFANQKFFSGRPAGLPTQQVFLFQSCHLAAVKELSTKSSQLATFRTVDIN